MNKLILFGLIFTQIIFSPLYAGQEKYEITPIRMNAECVDTPWVRFSDPRSIMPSPIGKSRCVLIDGLNYDTKFVEDISTPLNYPTTSAVLGHIWEQLKGDSLYHASKLYFHATNLTNITFELPALSTTISGNPPGPGSCKHMTGTLSSTLNLNIFSPFGQSTTFFSTSANNPVHPYPAGVEEIIVGKYYNFIQAQDFGFKLEPINTMIFNVCQKKKNITGKIVFDFSYTSNIPMTTAKWNYVGKFDIEVKINADGTYSGTMTGKKILNSVSGESLTGVTDHVPANFNPLLSFTPLDDENTNQGTLKFNLNDLNRSFFPKFIMHLLLKNPSTGAITPRDQQFLNPYALTLAALTRSSSTGSGATKDFNLKVDNILHNIQYAGPLPPQAQFHISYILNQ